MVDLNDNQIVGEISSGIIRDAAFIESILTFIGEVDNVVVETHDDRGGSGVDNEIYSTRIEEVVTQRARRSRNRRRRVRVNRNPRNNNNNTRASPARNSQVPSIIAHQVPWVVGIPVNNTNWIPEDVTPRQRRNRSRRLNRQLRVANLLQNCNRSILNVERQRDTLTVVTPFVENQPLFSNIVTYKREVSDSSCATSVSSFSSLSHHPHSSPPPSDGGDDDDDGPGGPPRGPPGGNSPPPSEHGLDDEPVPVPEVVLENILMRDVENVVPRPSLYQMFHSWRRNIYLNSAFVRFLCCVDSTMVDVAEEHMLRTNAVRECILRENTKCYSNDSVTQCINEIRECTGYNMCVADTVAVDENQEAIAEPYSYVPRNAQVIPKFTAAMFCYLRGKLGRLQRTDANTLLVEREYLHKCNQLNMRTVDRGSHALCTINTYFEERCLDSIADLGYKLPSWCLDVQPQVVQLTTA